MRKVRALQLKKSITDSLKRTPTKKEFRRAKKNYIRHV